MTKEFDWDERWEKNTCKVCGHQSITYFDTDTTKGEPFIRVAEKLVIHDKYDKVSTISQYVCPICGTIQVEV